MRIKATKGERIFQVCNYIFLTLLALICLYPLWHVIMASFSDSDALLAQEGLLLWPMEFTVDSYKRVFSNPQLIFYNPDSFCQGFLLQQKSGRDNPSAVFCHKTYASSAKYLMVRTIWLV